MKKSTLFVILVLISLSLLTFACSTVEDDDDEAPIDEISQWFPHNFDSHIFFSEHVQLNISSGGILQGTLIQENMIYYYYTDTKSISGTDITIVRYNVENGESLRSVLPFDNQTEIAGIEITGEGNAKIFAITHIEDEYDPKITAFYAEYDFTGNQRSKKDFNELFDYEAGSIKAQQALFIDNNYIVLSVTHNEWRGYNSSVYIINLDKGEASKLNSEYALFYGMITALNDGRVAVNEMMLNKASIREINIHDGTWGDIIATIDISAIMLFPAVYGSPYDLFIIDEDYVYGYNITNNDLTALLSWNETEIHIAWGIVGIGFFEDGQIYVLYSSWNDDREQELVLHMLTPAEREVLEGRIVMTLGGVNIGTYMTQAVARFNLLSTTHEIVIDEYNLTGDFMEGTWNAFSRLQVDLITGKGPDIIYNAWEAVANQNMLLDLHPFLLADKELSKEDFIPSFLSSLENSDGALYMIATQFRVDTMIGTSDVFNNIHNWTTEAFHEMIENINHMEYPLGVWMTNSRFVWLMLYSGFQDFVNLDTLEADFNNQAFINILEMAQNFYSYTDEHVFATLDHEFFRLRNGDQLLVRLNMRDITEYFLLSTVVPNFIPIGYPTETGGVHIVQPVSAPLGISAATEHPDAAWEFLRQFLKQTENRESIFPLRIDMFDQGIEYWAKPWYGSDEDGNRIELSRGTNDFGNGNIVTLYHLTEDSVGILRDIVKNAISGRSDVLGDLFYYVIEESLESFFSGIRSAEETAGVIQNRAQTYLNERD